MPLATSLDVVNPCDGKTPSPQPKPPEPKLFDMDYSLYCHCEVKPTSWQVFQLHASSSTTSVTFQQQPIDIGPKLEQRQSVHQLEMNIRLFIEGERVIHTSRCWILVSVCCATSLQAVIIVLLPQKGREVSASFPWSFVWSTYKYLIDNESSLRNILPVKV